MTGSLTAIVAALCHGRVASGTAQARLILASSGQTRSVDASRQTDPERGRFTGAALD